MPAIPVVGDIPGQIGQIRGSLRAELPLHPLQPGDGVACQEKLRSLFREGIGEGFADRFAEAVAFVIFLFRRKGLVERRPLLVAQIETGAVFRR